MLFSKCLSQSLFLPQCSAPYIAYHRCSSRPHTQPIIVAALGPLHSLSQMQLSAPYIAYHSCSSRPPTYPIIVAALGPLHILSQLQLSAPYIAYHSCSSRPPTQPIIVAALGPLTMRECQKLKKCTYNEHQLGQMNRTYCLPNLQFS